jgi:hypothetical protein
MRIGRGNLSTRRKPVPVPLRPPQIPHSLALNQGRSRRLTAWAMTQPTLSLKYCMFSGKAGTSTAQGLFSCLGRVVGISGMATA